MKDSKHFILIKNTIGPVAPSFTSSRPLFLDISSTVATTFCGVIPMEEILSLEGETDSIPPNSAQYQETIVNGNPPMPGAAQNPTSTGSDGPDSDCESGSDSDSEDEVEQNLQLQTLEAELSSNPCNYEAHVQV